MFFTKALAQSEMQATLSMICTQDTNPISYEDEY